MAVSLFLIIGIAVILLEIVPIGGFANHFRLLLHSSKIESAIQSEYYSPILDTRTQLDRKYVIGKNGIDCKDGSAVKVKDEKKKIYRKVGRLKYDLAKAALLKYKEQYGDMLVPRWFVVPINSLSFPPELWEIKLGHMVNNIRNLNTYSEYKDELKAIGFDYDSQWRFRYDDVKVALLSYKAVYGNMLVPQKFYVPLDSTDFPEEVKGMNLGSVVKEIRAGVYSEKREELLALGFIYVVRKKFDYESVKVAVYKYRELNHGSIKIPVVYNIRNNDLWYPIETWGMSLGNYVKRIKEGRKWPEKYSELFS
mmetsp:Transcript_24442/g.23485  ORF Transcript_24442/g.23485 Transcript_24442/m.23485 type:complete len:309 (+) Transcript_24442:170-1096(+)